MFKVDGSSFEIFIDGFQLGIVTILFLLIIEGTIAFSIKV